MHTGGTDKGPVFDQLLMVILFFMESAENS